MVRSAVNRKFGITMNMSCFRAIFILLLLLGLSGCATLSEDECRYSDWYDLGYRDGRQGRPADRVSEHAQACGEHGVKPDRSRYLSGHTDGVATYCTAHNGLRVGENGGGYANVCPRFEEEEFLRGYSLGQALYRVRSRLNSLDSEIDQLDNRISDEKTEKKEMPSLIYRRVELEGERGAALEELRQLEMQADTFG